MGVKLDDLWRPPVAILFIVMAVIVMTVLLVYDLTRHLFRRMTRRIRGEKA